VGSDLDGSEAQDGAGRAVSVNSDGSVVAMMSPYGYEVDTSLGNGEVKVYEFDGSDYVQKGATIDGQLLGNRSGWSLGMNEAGDVLAIGTPVNDGQDDSTGSVRVFSWDGAAWVQKGGDVEGEQAGERSGRAVSLDSTGDILAIGCTHSDEAGQEDVGHTRVYKFDGTAWNQIGDSIAGETPYDRSGHSLDMSTDGAVLAIGASENNGETGHVRVYKLVEEVVMSGDPMFKHKGIARHIWIPDGSLQPLLEWKAPNGAAMSLSGKTFVREETGHQWFDQLVVTQNGHTVLDVLAKETDLGTIKIDLEGVTLQHRAWQGPKGASKMYTSSKHPGLKVSASTLPNRLDIGSKHAEKVDIEAGGLAMTIFSAKAAKYLNPKLQAKYMHLNLKLQHSIPKGAKGIFAELAGVQPMTPSTEALLKRPKSPTRHPYTARKHRRARAMLVSQSD